MPDLDNMAKRVQGRWKFAVHVAIADADSSGTSQRLGQALTHILARCAASYAGVQQLPAFHHQLMTLASLPPSSRSLTFSQMQFPITPEGKECASKAARKVGIAICEGQIKAAEVGRALARQFLLAITQAEFFGRLINEDKAKIFKSPEAAAVHLLQAQREVEGYVDGTTSAFAESMFQRLQPVPKPELVRQDTAAQLGNTVEVNLALLDEYGDED